MPILGTVASQFAGKPFSSFESISTVSLNSSQASIEFTSIPATYTHLQFRFIVRTNRGNSEDAFRIKINGDTSAGNYNAHVLYGDGANDNAGEINTGVGWAGYYPTDSTSSVFGAGIMDFLETSTAAINSIVFTFDSGSSFTQYSQMALYGIKGA
jgi:hypothetical protein